MPGTGPNPFAADATSWETALAAAVLVLRPGRPLTTNEGQASVNLYLAGYSPDYVAHLLTGA